MRYDDNKLRETFQSLSKELIEGELEYNKEISESVKIIKDIAKGKHIIIDENISSKDLDCIWGVYKKRIKNVSSLDTYIVNISINMYLIVHLQLLFLYSLFSISLSKYQLQKNMDERTRTVEIKHTIEIILNQNEDSIIVKDFEDLNPVLEEELENLLSEMFKE